MARCNLIGERLRNERTRNGITLRELADRVGMREITLIQYEDSEISNVAYNRIHAIASVLGCKPADLMGIDESAAKTEQSGNGLGDFLRSARGDRSLGQIANESGIDKGYLSRVERGERMPKADKIRSLAEAYGVDIDTLVRVVDCWELFRTDNTELSPEELELVQTYRKLSPDGKYIVQTVAALEESGYDGD